MEMGCLIDGGSVFYYNDRSVKDKMNKVALFLSEQKERHSM